MQQVWRSTLITPFINGDEEDALTRAKRFYKWRARVRRRIKRGYNKRVRRRASASRPTSDVVGLMRILTDTVSIACMTFAALQFVDAGYLRAALLLTVAVAAYLARHAFRVPGED
jgi:hypothetical protein